jgi:hypothetical protein
LSECSLSFASVIVHRNVCMHTLHWMFIALALLSSCEPAGGGSGGQRVGRAGAFVRDGGRGKRPRRRGGVRRAPRSGRALEPGSARAVATAAANRRCERAERSSFERKRRAPLEAFCALASLSARALADFCALPPPIVTVSNAGVCGEV